MKTKIDWCKKELNPYFDFDRIAEVIGVPDLETMSNKYWDHCDTDEERDENWLSYSNALVQVFSRLCSNHGLIVEDVRDKAWLKRVKPVASWKKAAKEILETINGVGYFHFRDVNEFCRSGPYTERAAVLTHIHYIKRYPDVYGDTSVSRMMEIARR